MVGERDIVVISHGGHFYALDSFCYHAGGPLHEGDIEDLGMDSCVVCPWHKYKICLDNGHGLYMAVDPYNPGKAPEMKSKGAKQRTHTVTLRQGQVFVTLSSLDHKLDSDHYNCAEYRQKFNLR
ncbi:Rieske domain-containing protein-like isoform X2 [Babylonia areolata]